jgi:putative oxidoreductase
MKTTAELPVKKNKAANITAWILQILLGGMFIMTGAMKTFTPVEQLAGSLPWVTQVPLALVKFIGLAELLGGLGLILPSLLKIKTKLTPIAAIGIVLIMIFASIFHISRGETNVIGMNFILAALAGLVARLRLKKTPLRDKNVK